jgi:methionyl-tRNA formyltransferase
VINVHGSLLPGFRGASPIASAILSGEEETGVTIMLMDAGMDTGPVLARRSEPIHPTDTTGSLAERLSRLGADLLCETLPRWLAGDIEPEPQDDSLATVTHLIRKEDGLIDWKLPAAELSRRVRAYNPWPGAFTTLAGDHITIWNAWPAGDGSRLGPGTVVQLTDRPSEAEDAAFAVETGEGLLAVSELQRAGRKRVRSAEFLRGAPDLIGKRFGD